ncbi:MAG: hypothetical protein GQ569_06965, partial [Methylococcaceae bacterium]|nr:hypothetical protein [Methylococcaceae bacterium]
MKKIQQTPLALAIGTTLLSGLATTAQAETVDSQSNPFAMTELSEGYMQLAAAEAKESKKDKKSSKMKSGACGEGKCGGKMMKGGEEKTAEGNCAGNKPMPKTEKKMEGKCGEGK